MIYRVLFPWSQPRLAQPRLRLSTCSIGSRRVIAQLSDALKVDHRFAVAYTPWSNGTCERMVREVVHLDFLYVGSSGPVGSEGLSLKRINLLHLGDHG